MHNSGSDPLSKPSLQLPPECHQSEHQPGCNILWWPRTNWLDLFLQEIGQDINLQYALQ